MLLSDPAVTDLDDFEKHTGHASKYIDSKYNNTEAYYNLFISTLKTVKGAAYLQWNSILIE